MSTNTNTKQTRQNSKTNPSHNTESHCDHGPDYEHIELDLDPDTTPFGHVHCPRDGCERTVETLRGLPMHYGWVHKDESLIIDLVGKETWVAYLKQEHVEHRRTAEHIAVNISHPINVDTVMADLKRFGIYEPFPESNVAVRDILEHEDVTTIEEARAMSRKLNKEGEA